MKQKQLFIILGAAGILLWVYSIYSSIPFAKHLNFNTFKMILENMLSLESLVTPLGFIIVIAGKRAGLTETVFVSPEAALTVRVPLRELVLAFAVAVTTTEHFPDRSSEFTEIQFGFAMNQSSFFTSVQ